jgi:translation initiation factor IF-2
MTKPRGVKTPGRFMASWPHARVAAQRQADADEPVPPAFRTAGRPPVAAAGRPADRGGPGDRGRPGCRDRRTAGPVPPVPDGGHGLQHRAGHRGRADTGRVRPPGERPARRRRAAPVRGRALRPGAVGGHAAPRHRVGPGPVRGGPGAPPRRPPDRLRHARHAADPPHAHRRARLDPAAPRAPAGGRPGPPGPGRPAHRHGRGRHGHAFLRPQGRLTAVWSAGRGAFPPIRRKARRACGVRAVSGR